MDTIPLIGQPSNINSDKRTSLINNSVDSEEMLNEATHERSQKEKSGSK